MKTRGEVGFEPLAYDDGGRVDVGNRCAATAVEDFWSSVAAGAATWWVKCVEVADARETKIDENEIAGGGVFHNIGRCDVEVADV
jgi:hypothetical protein